MKILVPASHNQLLIV